MRCNVYPAKKKRTISMFLLRKIPSLLIGVFGLTCRLVPPRAAQPGYLPVPATAGAVPPGPPGQASPVPVPSAPLGVDLAVLVQDMGIHAGNHVNLRMARVALGGLQVAVVQFQLVGGAGMPLRYNKDKRKNPVFSRVSAFVVAYSIPFPTLIVNEKSVE